MFLQKQTQNWSRFSHTPMTKAGNKTQHGPPFSETGPWRTASCHCRVLCEGLQPLQRGCGRWHRSPRRISRAVGTQHRTLTQEFWGGTFVWQMLSLGGDTSQFVFCFFVGTLLVGLNVGCFEVFLAPMLFQFLFWKKECFDGPNTRKKLSKRCSRGQKQHQNCSHGTHRFWLAGK